MAIEYPPVDGPTEGPLVYVVYGSEDQVLYVGSTRKHVNSRLAKHRINQWMRNYAPLYVRTTGPYESEIEMYTAEQEAIHALNPSHNKVRIVGDLTGALNRATHGPKRRVEVA